MSNDLKHQRVIEKPLEFLENILVWSEEAALRVAIAIDQSAVASVDMRYAAWNIAERKNVFLSCPYCRRTMFNREQHKDCQRQSASDEFVEWLVSHEDDFDDLVEETIVNEDGSSPSPQPHDWSTCVECSSPHLQTGDQLHGTCSECGKTW